MEDSEGPEEHIVLDAMLCALFHDFPETLTGDIITPAKDILNRSCEGLWDKVEERLVSAFLTELVPESLCKDITERKLLHKLSDSEIFSTSSLVKDCDRLALVIECHLEFQNGNINGEMTNAFKEYLNVLQGSEWKKIREFAQRMAIESR
jgi:5'-deoxynucleotidase YfbR-like HD superfamily hydrolase